jgi:hypothetical protein
MSSQTLKLFANLNIIYVWHSGILGLLHYTFTFAGPWSSKVLASAPLAMNKYFVLVQSLILDFDHCFFFHNIYLIIVTKCIYSVKTLMKYKIFYNFYKLTNCWSVYTELDLPNIKHALKISMEGVEVEGSSS